jgi:copper(I)-binding protein
MRNFLKAVCLALVPMVASLAHAGDIMVKDGWARASIGNASNSAAYMTVMTHGDAADRLIAASTPVAGRAELHNHIMEDGIARMRPVDAIDVKPGEPMTLEPGGLHIMLMDLTEKLEPGADVPLTLTFENAGDVTVELPVQPIGASAPSDDAHQGHDEHQKQTGEDGDQG